MPPLAQIYASYLMWCLVWGYRTPPTYEDWLKLREGRAAGEGRNFVLGWEGVK